MDTPLEYLTFYSHKCRDIISNAYGFTTGTAVVVESLVC